MTQVIEIVVIGAVGSSKSHVMEVLARALRAQYGIHAQITSHELSLEKNLGHEPTKPCIADTIFNLREQASASGKLGELKVSVDASELTSAIDKLEAVQGEAVSFMLDPLEQAIESAARVLRDEHEHLAQIRMTASGDVSWSPVYKRMSAHLEALLSRQLRRVGDDGHR